MLYFLVIILPFFGGIGYLFYQNSLLKKKYKQVEEQLFIARKAMHLEHISFPMGINRDFVVTENALKRLENFIVALEEAFALPKAPVVANMFKPKAEKLDILHKRAAKLVTMSKAPTQPTV
jgi:hypothetical protein